MNQSKAIEKLLKDNGRKKVWLSEQMGYTRSNAISQMLMRGNISVDILYEICEIMGYEISIQPKRRAGARPQGQIIIEGKIKERTPDVLDHDKKHSKSKEGDSE